MCRVTLKHLIFRLLVCCICQPRSEKHTSRKRSCVHADTKKWRNTKVVSSTKADTAVKQCNARRDAFVVPAEITLGPQKPCKDKVIENNYSVECVKKKKRSSQQYVSSDDDGICCDVPVDQCSLPAVTKPHVKLKPLAKCVKTAKKCLKSGCSNDSRSLSLASRSVCEPLLVDSSLLSKRRKTMQNSEEVNSATKLKKVRRVDSKVDEIHAVANECSVGPDKRNFNVVKLRSVLQQNGRLSDVVSDQDRLCDDLSFKNSTFQTDQEPATESAKHEKIDANISQTTKSSLHSEKGSLGSSSGLLKERMLNRLAAARFRFINEQMYRSTGSEAAEMFAHDEDAFTIYHAGFQSQVSKWPMNPVDRMIDYINSSGMLTVVADFGCGDAKIARSVANVVHSFDLVALNEHVTACDMAHVPLKKASVDIAVFCLSLMGTNIVQYLVEASRVLKLGGVLLVAEVISRFEKIGSFVRKLRKLGFELENKVVNKMFVWFEMKKICEVPAEDSMPSIELYPCVYKKR